MSTLAKAIIEAFHSLGKDEPRRKKQIDYWLSVKYPGFWKDVGTMMADMVPYHEGGNVSSAVPEHLKVLIRIEKGIYQLRI